NKGYAKCVLFLLTEMRWLSGREGSTEFLNLPDYLDSYKARHSPSKSTCRTQLFTMRRMWDCGFLICRRCVRSKTRPAAAKDASASCQPHNCLFIYDERSDGCIG